MPHFHDRLALGNRLQTLARAGLVNHIDCLVGQMSLIDMTRSQLSRGLQGIIRIGNAVVLFEPRLQAHEDLERLRHRGLDDIDLLEAPRQSMVFLEDAPVFLVRGRADATDLAIGQHGLDQVGGIHDTTGSRARANDGMNLINEKDRARLFLQLRDHAFQTLLEVTAIFSTGNQRTHVERIEGAVGQHFRHSAFDNQPRQALSDRGLANPGLTDIQRVVLAPAAQNLDRALDFELASDQRIDTPVLGHAVQIAGVLLERAAAFGIALGIGLSVLFVRCLLLGNFRQAVGDVVDDVESCHMLTVQQEHGVALLLAENRDQHVGDTNFFLAARLHMEHCSLQHSLEAQRRLHLTFLALLDTRRRLLDVLFQLLLQLAQIGAAGAQDLSDLGCVQDRKQQMLDRQILVTRFPRLVEGIVETVFKLV